MVQEMLKGACAQVIAFSTIVGFCFVLFATSSCLTAAACALTICAVIATWTGLAVMSGTLSQGLGAIESLVLMVSACMAHAPAHDSGRKFHSFCIARCCFPLAMHPPFYLPLCR